MWWLIKFCWLGHIHRWKILKEVELLDTDRDRIGTRYHLQCEKCGDVVLRQLK